MSIAQIKLGAVIGALGLLLRALCNAAQIEWLKPDRRNEVRDNCLRFGVIATHEKHHPVLAAAPCAVGDQTFFDRQCVERFDVARSRQRRDDNLGSAADSQIDETVALRVVWIGRVDDELAGPRTRSLCSRFNMLLTRRKQHQVGFADSHSRVGVARAVPDVGGRTIERCRT